MLIYRRVVLKPMVTTGNPTWQKRNPHVAECHFPILTWCLHIRGVQPTRVRDRLCIGLPRGDINRPFSAYDIRRDIYQSSLYLIIQLPIIYIIYTTQCWTHTWIIPHVHVKLFCFIFSRFRDLHIWFHGHVSRGTNICRCAFQLISRRVGPAWGASYF